MKQEVLLFLSERLYSKLSERFKPYEIRSSLVQIAARWEKILTRQEKKKVARILGGNRYSVTTYELLGTLFEEIVKDDSFKE